VAIGSSTGGPSALLHVLTSLPADFPVPVLIAQHIADGFVPGLVGWLDAATDIDIVAAEHGMPAEPGRVYFATTGLNMGIASGAIEFVEPEPGQLYVPSADTLFRSALREFGARAVGVILTGMGADGAEGLKALHDVGAPTLAESEHTCTVYGMPRAAIELGAASTVLRVEAIGPEVVRLVTGD
jgi:two-component system chemotaxis response regulator CheB